MRNQKIIELVDQNYKVGSLLHMHGIDFFKVADVTLQDVCKRFRIDEANFTDKLERLNSGVDCTDAIDELQQLSVDFIIGYLRSAHQAFVRHKLPYMLRMVSEIEPSRFDFPNLINDFKLIFPHFVEDFIHHIHEEESSVFAYIQRLDLASQQKFNLSRVFEDLSRNSMQQIAEHHLDEDDEMKGIKDMTDDYYLPANASVYTKTLYAEFKSFESDLKIHSSIENDVLFPKAMKLERFVVRQLDRRAKYN